MAQYNTNAEAQKDLAKKLHAAGAELKKIYDSKDPKEQARAEELKTEIGAIQNKLMVSQDGVSGMFGSLGGGLAKGVMSAVTAVPDLAGMASNYLSGENKKLLGERATPGLETTRENAGLFGVGKGLGSSLGFGKLMTALNTGATTVDEMAAGGNPVAQSILAVGTLGVAGAQGARNLLKNHQVKRLLAELPAEEANALQQFMLKGQSATDPLIAGKVAALRSNPKYADLFNVLEAEATKVATEGARASTAKGYPKEDAGSAIFQAVDGQVQKLRENITQLPKSKFDAALKMGGNNDIMMTDNTVKNISELMVEYASKGTDDAKAALGFLGRIRNDLDGKRISPEKIQALLQEFGSQAKQGESLITDVSLGSQKRIATAIFGGLKDDLVKTGQESSVERIRNVARLLDDARGDVATAYGKYSDFVAQGLPAKLKDTPLNAVDTESLLETVKGLSNAQRDRLAGVLQTTAPEDLKRVRQVMYDDFVQSARTVLPDGSTGVDLKLLAQKYNTLPENQKTAMAFAVGTNADDFASRMKDAEGFFKYQQKFGGADNKQFLSGGDIAELSTAGYVAGGYGTGKSLGLAGRLMNTIKGGLSDEQTLNLLMSPETKTLLRDTVTNPNSVKTLGAIEKSIFSPALSTTAQGAQVGSEAVQQQGQPSSVPQKQSAPTERPSLDLTAPETTTGGERPSLDLSYNSTDIEKQIRAEAEKQGLGQHADLLVRQAKQESGFNPYVTSKAGAAGVFQHMPKTAQELGIDPYDPSQSIQGGVQYMGQLLKKYNGNKAQALAAYNWGMGNVDRQGMNNMPAETQDYLRNILGA
jgi:ubiquitin